MIERFVFESMQQAMQQGDEEEIEHHLFLLGKEESRGAEWGAIITALALYSCTDTKPALKALRDIAISWGYMVPNQPKD